MPSPLLTLWQVLKEEYRSINGEPADIAETQSSGAPLSDEDKLKLDEVRLKEVYEFIRRKKHSALCLSGGGIRSATFNLGILQGLARHNLLGKFDYLSTVSGGGFIGSWLTAWIHRAGIDEVVKELSKRPDSPLVPDPKPVSWLREYSNYLSPKLSLLDADTWTLVSTYLRNLLLNWLVFIPVLMAVLMLPRFWVAFVAEPTITRFDSDGMISLVTGFLTGTFALGYICLNLPGTRAKNYNQNYFLLLCLSPMMISAMSLTKYWAGAIMRGMKLPGYYRFMLFAVALVAVPWAVCIVCYIKNFLRDKSRRDIRDKSRYTALGLTIGLLFSTIFIVVAQCIIGYLTWAAANWFTSHSSTIEHPRSYATFAVPLLLALLALGGTLLAGLTSRYTEDDDQEWWARSGAWIIIVIVGWIVVSVLVLFVPSLVSTLPVKLANFDWKNKETLTALGAVASILVTIFGGFSAKTPANDNEAQKGGLLAKVSGIVLSLVATVGLAFIIVYLALLTDVLLVSNGALLPSFMARPMSGYVPFMHDTTYHREVVINSPLLLLLEIGALLTLIGSLAGRLISTNKFSLHYMWRNRIIRAYLGASNTNRAPNLFTGFDAQDNIQMHELRGPCSPKPKKLMHVVNIALNLVSGHDLAWQQRKAESFTVSPLHAGSYRPNIGYRDVKYYGRQNRNGRQGISLGTAIAISGAFVSPNMGYMMTSPVIRFLMTLFNVRFGWWLGNPGRNGDTGGWLGRTYDRESPRLSVKPIFQEAFGMTDDAAAYVYLSDGGHFENLGLYEMVLRRARLIVVSDASTDPDYSFQSLGMSIRQIRIDLGIPIEFEKFLIAAPAINKGQTSNKAYCALGKIPYSCVDKKDSKKSNEEYDGILIYIKPTLFGDESRDVLNYAHESTSFPQEIIVDQWFSESQFESYRALGSHIIDRLCQEADQPVDDRNKFADLNAFRANLEKSFNQISLTQSERQSLDDMKKIPDGIEGIPGFPKKP